MIHDMALSQMPTGQPSAADEIFFSQRQPSAFCDPFVQLRPSATETIKLPFHNDVMYGTQAAIIVPHWGDLMVGACLEVKMKKYGNEFPASRAAYYPVEALCKRVTLSIAGITIDTHTSNFFRLYDEYVRCQEESQNYRRIANFDQDTLCTAAECTETLYLPLIFSFFRDRRCPLNLAGIKDVEVRLTFDFADAETVGTQPDVFEAAVFADFVLVDPPVRHWLSTNPITVVYEQVQWNGGQMIDPAREDTFVNARAKLGFRRPVKALFWFLQEEHAQFPDRTMHARWVGDPQDTYLCLQPSQNDFGGYNLLQSISEKLAPLRKARLLFNGRDRFPPRSARFFNSIHALKYCRRSPLPGSYMYAFSDQVGSVQPTPGLCNFSNFNDIQMLFQLKKTTSSPVTDPSAFSGDDAEDFAKNIDGLNSLHIYAWSYNVCTFHAGSFRVALQD